MKRTTNWILSLALAGGLGLATAALAEPTEAQLMKEAKITKAEAEKIALEKVPAGQVQSAEIENEHHALVWSFDIAKPGSKNITEVLVNAKTGKIISVMDETPADQAKEKAADLKK